MKRILFITAVSLAAMIQALWAGELSDLKYEELLRLETVRFVRDPFQRPRQPASVENILAEAAGLKLSGIISGPYGRVAIIGGEDLRPGGALKGFLIREIGEEYVILEKSGIRKELRIEEFSLAGE